ncbi:MAG: CBS domain-containing protein [bacterium]|nr:CBS domain-containing protein [bacterium]
MRNKLVQDFKPYAPIQVVSQETSICAIVELFLEKPATRYFCVTDDTGALIGLIGRKRLFKGVFSHHVSSASMVRQLYTLVTSESAMDLLIHQVQLVKETDDLDRVIKIIVEHDLAEIPVVSETNQVLGFMTISMILKDWLARSREDQ